MAYLAKTEPSLYTDGVIPFSGVLLTGLHGFMIRAPKGWRVGNHQWGSTERLASGSSLPVALVEAIVQADGKVDRLGWILSCQLILGVPTQRILKQRHPEEDTNVHKLNVISIIIS